MTPSSSGLGRPAFGGISPLEGDNLVRLVYLDEAGISRREPIVVVAGVMVNADRTLAALEDHLDNLVEKYIPLPDRQHFVFHAKDIWNAKNGYFKDNEKWPLSRRLEILDDLVKIPELLQIPIVYGKENKAELRDHFFSSFRKIVSREPTEHEFDIEMHSLAFLECAIAAEFVLRQWSYPEIGMLIAENRDDARRAIKQTHSWIRGGSEKVEQIAKSLRVDLPLRKIRDTVHFAEKTESKSLQLADVCAFLLRGYFEGRKNNSRFLNPLRPWICFAKDDETLGHVHADSL